MIIDAGDVPAADGFRVRPGKIYRLSGGLAKAGELQALEAAGLRRIVDLRGTDEDRSVIQNWAEANGADYESQPIPAARREDFLRAAAEAETEESAFAYMRELYERVVDDFGPQIAATIGAMSRDLPAGFGCAAGKDRTGIVNALLHILLGVPEEEAAMRYVNGAPSVERLGPLARNVMELEESEPLPLGVEVLLRATPELINAAIAEAKRTDGTIQGYLEHHGLAPEAVERLREQLLEPASPVSGRA
jgi:protein-tyrosine phosphatase